MARIMAFDYGLKRVGVAVTDPLKLIANGLPTVLTHQIFPFLDQYLQRENVELFIVGKSFDLRGELNEAQKQIEEFKRGLARRFPVIPQVDIDERFTSKMASAAISEGLPKMKRRDKAMVDRLSATLILQTYLQQF